LRFENTAGAGRARAASAGQGAPHLCVYGVGVRERERGRGERERRERERETSGYAPFALHAPIHWAISGYVIKETLQVLDVPERPRQVKAHLPDVKEGGYWLFFFFFITLDTASRRPLSLELNNSKSMSLKHESL